VVSAIIVPCGQIEVAEIAAAFVWQIFGFTVFSTIGSILMELMLPDPDLGK
jgi:hypothetical protein